MRHRSIALFAPLAAALFAVLAPGQLLAQGRAQNTTFTATVPSIVRYVVDETIRTADGSPTIRVVTNDPAIRAAFARGVAPELAPVTLGATTPERSTHSKGDGRLESTADGSKVLRYTVVAP